MELLMLVNQPQKWTLNGVIGKGWFATLNGVTLHISNPKWRNEPKSYPKWRIGQNLTLNGVLGPSQLILSLLFRILKKKGWGDF